MALRASLKNTMWRVSGKDKLMARARKGTEKNRSAKIKKRNARDIRTVFSINDIMIYTSFKLLFPIPFLNSLKYLEKIVKKKSIRM